MSHRGDVHLYEQVVGEIVRDVGHLLFLPEGEERIEANYFAVHDGEFSVPPTNERYTHSTECVLDEPMQFASIIGHMHEWGKRITIEKIDGEGVIQTIYEVDAWHAGLRDAPPVTHYPLDNALALEAGDTLRLTCEWVNDTDEDREQNQRKPKQRMRRRPHRHRNPQWRPDEPHEPYQRCRWPYHAGTGTDAKTFFTASSTVNPSTSNSGRRISRCSNTAGAMAFTSSGVT